MNSFDTNYIFNDNKNLGQYDLNAIPSQMTPCYSYPASLMNQNEIPIEHEYFDQYDSYVISSEIIPCYSYPESLANQNNISIELSR